MSKIQSCLFFFFEKTQLFVFVLLSMQLSQNKPELTTTNALFFNKETANKPEC